MTTAPNLLELHDVVAGYGPVTVLNGLSLTVAPQERLAVIGRNGVGKTTALRAVMGLAALRSGRIVFDGQDLARLAPHQRAQLGLGYVPQTRDIFPSLSVEENLLAGCKRRPRGAIDEAYALFPRLAERRSQVGGTLSGGEQQMLAIGRALMARPRVLLLDEPSMGLAPMVISQIFKIISEINAQGTTVLLVEQNAQQALSRSDRAYILETGSVTRSGPARELLADDSIRAAYLGVA